MKAIILSALLGAGLILVGGCGDSSSQSADPALKASVKALEARLDRQKAEIKELRNEVALLKTPKPAAILGQIPEMLRQLELLKQLGEPAKLLSQIQTLTGSVGQIDGILNELKALNAFKSALGDVGQLGETLNRIKTLEAALGDVKQLTLTVGKLKAFTDTLEKVDALAQLQALAGLRTKLNAIEKKLQLIPGL